MSIDSNPEERFELPGLNSDYFRDKSFPAQEALLEQELYHLHAASEDNREDLIPGVKSRLESYRFIGRCAGVEFPTDLEQRTNHALGIE